MPNCHVQKPGLRLLRFQARPEPTWSPCQGWALAGLEQAQLGRLRASGPAQHITSVKVVSGRQEEIILIAGMSKWDKVVKVAHNFICCFVNEK